MGVKKQTFNDFEVYSSDEYTSFVHINITNSKLFYSQMFEYFFDENILWELNKKEKTVSKIKSSPE